MALTQEEIHYWMRAVFGEDWLLREPVLRLRSALGTSLQLGHQLQLSVHTYDPTNHLYVDLTDTRPNGKVWYQRQGHQVETDLVGMLFEAHGRWVVSFRRFAKSTPFTRPGFGPFHAAQKSIYPPMPDGTIRLRRPLEDQGPDLEEEGRAWALVFSPPRPEDPNLGVRFP